MFIFPHFHYSISSALPANQVYQIAIWADIFLLGYSYTVSFAERKGKQLVFYPENNRQHMYDPFLPIVRISFSETEDGTDIILDAKMRSKSRKILLYILIGGLFLTGVLLFLWIFPKAVPVGFVFIPLSVSLGAYLVAYIVLFILSKSFYQQFSEDFR